MFAIYAFGHGGGVEQWEDGFTAVTKGSLLIFP
jgi:hypothetical protein